MPSRSENLQRQVHAAGGCLCGAVRYKVYRPLEAAISACHCHQCRRHQGAVGYYTGAPVVDVEIFGEASLRWYRSSETARRGFCGVCGSKLFWQRDGADWIDLTPGSLDDSAGLRLAYHIFWAHGGDYETVADDLPRYPDRRSE